jgi:bacterioferritin
MQGNINVLNQLHSLLKGELAARDQYFIHAQMYADWGLTKLYNRIHHEMEEETQHATALIQRLLFLGSTADLSQRGPLNVGTTVPTMLKSDLDLEYQVIGELKTAIAVCEKEQDYQSRDILLQILADTEEDHAYWLEQQLRLIEWLGLPNYLQSQRD